jgi:hypothetical protein
MTRLCPATKQDGGTWRIQPHEIDVVPQRIGLYVPALDTAPSDL